MMDRACKKRLNKTVSQIMDLWAELYDFYEKYDGNIEDKDKLLYACDMLDEAVICIEEDMY